MLISLRYSPFGVHRIRSGSNGRCTSPPRLFSTLTLASSSFEAIDQNTPRQFAKQKFLAAFDSIKYHDTARERRPQPTPEELHQVEQALGYFFKDRELLQFAFIHRSCSSTNNTALAWIGDSALQLVITEQLAAAEGCAAVGQLAQLREVLVSRAQCGERAKELNLGAYLVIAKGLLVKNEIENTSLSTAVLGELFESVVGAVYLDSGIAAVRQIYTQKFSLEKELLKLDASKKEVHGEC